MSLGGMLQGADVSAHRMHMYDDLDETRLHLCVMSTCYKLVLLS